VGDQSKRVIDLSHRVRNGEVTYPGLPAPIIDEFLTHEDSRSHYTKGTEFSISRIATVGNTGTYLDAPFHRIPDGVDLAGVPLERLVNVPAVVVRVVGGPREVEVAELERHEVAGKAVLINTGWDKRPDDDQLGSDKPFVTRAAAEWLVAHDAAVVGIDVLNIDSIDDLSRPAHSTLLMAGIPIVEHMRDLDRLPDDGVRFTAAPAAVEQMGTWPVRAFATVDGA
jgi:kynurenine formamidase